MGSLSNLYISQSYTSLLHLGNDGPVTDLAPGEYTQFQDGLGNSLGISVNASGDISSSGNIYAANIFPTISTSSFNQYTASTNSRLNNIESTTASLNSSVTQLNANTASQQVSINALNQFTASQSTASIVTSIDNLNTFTASANIRLNNLETTSASVNISISNLNSTTASQATSISNLNTSASLALITASLSGQTLTFTKGNNSTFGIILPDVSGSDITALNQFTASQLLINTGYNTFTSSTNTSITELNTFSASAKISISALNSATSSYVTETESGSFLITASFDNNNRNLTFTKGDNTTFNVNIPDVSGSAGDFVTTASFNAYTQSNDQKVNSLEVNSASVNVSISNLNQFSQSTQISINSLNGATSSYANSASVALVDANQQSQINSLIAATGSYLTASADITALNAFTASQLNINTGYNTFTQSANQRLNSIESVSGSWITESETASFARTNIDNNFTANQTFTNITAVSASFTYVQTLYETSSVIYSSGSNQFGDELSDIQTLSGSVKVQGSLTVNGTPVLTSSVDISGLTTTASFNQYTQSNNQRVSSLEVNSASVNTSISALNQFTASQSTASLVTSIDNLNQFSASTLVSLSNLNSTTQSLNTSVSNLNQATSSLFGSASLALITASASGNTITFTKGNSSTFSVSVDTGSAATTIFEVVFTGENITKGDPLYISGSQGANPIVFKADASNPAKMPVTFVSNETIGVSNTTNAIVLGLIEGIDLTGYVPGQTIYVAEGGGWSTSLPSGSNSITQLLGVVTKGGSGGKGLVLNPGPAQLPGLDSGYLWAGNDNNQPIEITTASFASSASFNTYTSSNDQKVNSLISATGSYATTGSNNFVGDQIITGSLYVSSSVQKDVIIEGQLWISSSNMFASGSTVQPQINISGPLAGTAGGSRSGSALITAAQVIFNRGTKTSTVGNTVINVADTSIGPAGQSSGIYPGGLDNGTLDGNEIGLTINGDYLGVTNFSGPSIWIADNTLAYKAMFGFQDTTNYTDGRVTVFTPLSASAGFTASLQNGYVWVGNSLGQNTQVATSSFIDNQVTSASFNAYTQSNDQKVNSLISATGSYATTGSNAFFGTNTFSGAVSFTGSVPSILSQSFSGSLITNLTDIYTNVPEVQQIVTLTSASYAALLSGSLTNPNTLYIVSGSTDLQSYVSNTTFNSYTSSTNSRLNNIETTTASLLIETQNLELFSASALTSINSLNGATGSYATTGSNTFVGEQRIYNNQVLRFTNQGTFSGDSGSRLSADSYTGMQFRNFSNNDIIFEQIGTASLNFYNYNGGIGITGSSTSIQGVDFIPFSASLNTRINTLNTATGSFAITGSNTFTGDQTLIDAAGNTITLSDISGSLMLVAKTFTSASAHISASAGNQVNLIFKNNSNTADTIISGSNNLFVNATAPTAGFKRYVGGSGNIMLNPGNVPQISGSMAFSPLMSNNFFGGAAPIGGAGLTMTIRGPVSSSAWNINGNAFTNTISIGTSAANNAEKMVSGFTMGNNNINTTFGLIANRTLLKVPVSISNNFINQAPTLTVASSSITFVSNIGGAISITNAASGGLVESGADAIYVNRNIFSGQSNTITATGSQDPNDLLGESFLRNVEHSQIIGSNNGVNLPYAPTGSNSLTSTTIAGNALSVTGSNRSSIVGGSQNYGSAFFGRYNAQDGNRAQSAQTIFAVGTGNETTRKTGFLIDSGSNTFIEGTLNVSGSTTITGSLILSSSAAVELQVIGGSEFTGSVGISQTLQLGQLDPLPTGADGQLAVSASNLYFYSGSAWNKIAFG